MTPSAPRPQLVGRPSPLLGAALAAVVCLATGCDPARLQEEGATTPDPVVQPETLRSRVSMTGLADLYRTAHAGMLPAEADATQTNVDGSPVSIGPLDAAFPVASWTTSVDGELLTLELDADDASVIVPVRVPKPIGVRICRFRLRADRWRIEARAVNRAADGWDLETVGPPDLQTSGQSVEAVGSCPDLLGDRGRIPESLHSALTSFLTDAVDGGIQSILATSPFDTMGLLRREITLQRLSAFSNRSGRLRLVGRFPETDAMRLTTDGLAADLNVGISAGRATCAPPENLQLPPNRQADPLPASALSEADVGIALAAPLLRRLARASTLGGFLCRGLESDAPPLTTATLTPETARLADIGLDGLGAGGELSINLSPGGLPELRLRPDIGAIALTFRDLGLAIYGRMRGVRSRIVELTTTATFTLRPNIGEAGRLAMTVNAVDIQDVSVQSVWTDGPMPRTGLSRWSRRLLFLVFEDAFSFPLPLTPGAPLELRRARVRSDDLLLFFDVPAP